MSLAGIMDSVERAKKRVRVIIADSPVPEDVRHAENTLEWLLKLDPTAGQALRIAALAHDVDRALEDRRVRRADFDDYDDFKAAHARNSACILREILARCGVDARIAEEACRLTALHEIGGDTRSDLLKDADSISYFDVNMPSYFAREGWQETRRRCMWGYSRLSPRMKEVARRITHRDKALTCLLREAIAGCEGDDRGASCI